MKRKLLVLLLLLPAFSHGIETPSYEVVAEYDGFEIRHYDAYITASTVVDGDFESAGNAAFRPLFDYISGGNAGEEKISMTAPVEQVPVGEGFRVSFVMPAGFAMDTLPAPYSDQVSFAQAGDGLIAVWRYRGDWSEARFNRFALQLRQGLERTPYVTCGPAVVARYNPPFWPRWLKRNEVLIRVAKEACPEE